MARPDGNVVELGCHVARMRAAEVGMDKQWFLTPFSPPDRFSRERRTMSIKSVGGWRGCGVRKLECPSLLFP